MIVKDWIKEAAVSIWGEHYSCEDIEEIIRKHCPMKPDTAYVELGGVQQLASLLVESKREHHHEDDCRYCCGKCRHPDHGLEHADDWLSSHRDRQGGVCDCGDDKWNQRVDEAIRGYLSIG